MINLEKAYYFAAKLYASGSGVKRKISGYYSLMYNIIHSCSIPPSCKIGKNVYFAHRGIGIVINEKAIIGDDVKIYQNVTIGGQGGTHDNSQPLIGDRVFIGCHSCILGGVKVGNDVTIGANSVVINDIPDGATVVGSPARVIKIKRNE